MKPPPPTINGVGPSTVWLPQHGQEKWPTVLDFLVHRFATLTRDEIAGRMLRGEITDDDGLAVPLDAAYTANRKLHYYRMVLDEPRIPFEEAILFEDELLLAVDKPHFLPTTPGGRHLQETLLVRLKQKLGLASLTPMHRLDRETAGVVLFTKQLQHRGAYQLLFQQRQVNKQYLAVAPWRDDVPLPMTCRSRIVESDHFMRMCETPGAPNAETSIELLARHGQWGLYRLTPLTGKKHQLRVHMAALGLPIVYDQIYPRHVAAGEGDMGRPLQLLAQSINFTDPVTGMHRQFESRRRLLHWHDNEQTS